MKIKNNTLKFDNHEEWYEGTLKISKDIKKVDFNKLLIFKGTLDLSESTLTCIDLKEIRRLDDIYNPYNIKIVGKNLIYSNYNKGDTPKLDWYKDKNKPLIYLGGKIDGGLDENGKAFDSLLEERFKQERILLSRNSIRVYNPGGVITYPDKGVTRFPIFPGEIDLKVIDEADYLFYDLRQVSEGTRAEFGYSIGRNYHKTKKIFVLVNDNITNCLTLALLKHCIIVENMNQVLDLIEYAEELKKVRKVNFAWWKNNQEMESKLNREYELKWKTKEEVYFTSNIQKYIDAVEFKYKEKFNFYNMLLAINCEILEYLESKNKEELSDIFIFSTLLYKTLNSQQNYKLNFKLKKDVSHIEIKPITHSNLFEYLPQLLQWSGQLGDKILEKIEYNNARQDHKKQEC